MQDHRLRGCEHRLRAVHRMASITKGRAFLHLKTVCINDSIALGQHTSGLAAGRYVSKHSAGVVRMFLCNAMDMATLTGSIALTPSVLHHSLGKEEWIALFICAIVQDATSTKEWQRPMKNSIAGFSASCTWLAP